MTSRVVLTTDQLVASLEAQILDGTLAAGTLLPSERRLVELHGLARSGVREAMRTLQERGLVEVVGGKGTFVREAHSADAAKVFGLILHGTNVTLRHVGEARMLIECYAVAEAARVATADELARIEARAAAFEKATGYVEMTATDLAYHASLVDAAHNPVLSLMFGALADYIGEMMVHASHNFEIRSGAGSNHWRIFQAVRAGRAAAARRLMREHQTFAFTAYTDDELDAPIAGGHRRSGSENSD